MKETEIALEISKEKFRFLFENSHDPIFLCNLKTSAIVDCNKAAEILIERKKSELIGKLHNVLFSKEKFKLYKNKLRKNNKNKKIINFDAEILTKTGKIILVNIKELITNYGQILILNQIKK